MPGPVQSIERAAAILRLLARGSGRLGVGEIATSLGLAKGTTHGILRTLQGVGFVEQDKASGKYQLGATLLHLGTYTAGGLPLQFPDGVQDDAAALAWLAAWKPKAAP